MAASMSTDVIDFTGLLCFRTAVFAFSQQAVDTIQWSLARTEARLRAVEYLAKR